MKLPIVQLVLFFSLFQSSLAETTHPLPEPGPENHGLRLRLVVVREMKKGDETFKVRIDLMNTTRKPIMLTADWPHDSDEGDFRDYLEASVLIQSYPEIGQWIPQIMSDSRMLPQPKVELAGGGVITAEWRTTDRKLKNTGLRYESNPLVFPSDGLYSVHVTTTIHTDSGKCYLRSNEQLVPIGGSLAEPKHSVGKITRIDTDAKAVDLDLGSRHKIAVGDTFDIRVGMAEIWRMTVDRVSEWKCSGKIMSRKDHEGDPKKQNPIMPDEGDMALLIKN